MVITDKYSPAYTKVWRPLITQFPSSRRQNLFCVELYRALPKKLQLSVFFSSLNSLQTLNFSTNSLPQNSTTSLLMFICYFHFVCETLVIDALINCNKLQQQQNNRLHQIAANLFFLSIFYIIIISNYCTKRATTIRQTLS